MKIGVCFSGQIRNYKKITDFINLLQSKFDVKIFSSLWGDGDTLGFLKEFKHTQYEIESFDYSYFNLNKYKEKYGNDYPSSSLPMYYKIYKANLLKSIYEYNHSKFDVIIRSRTDLDFLNFIDEEELNDVVNDNNIIYLRRGTDHAPEFNSITPKFL